MIQTADILRQWGAPKPLVVAGRYHAIYGTESYKPSLVDTKSRFKVAAGIGTEAERYIFLYSKRDSYWFSKLLDSAKDFDTKYYLPMVSGHAGEWITGKELSSLSAICLANAIEQSSRQPLWELDDMKANQWAIFAKLVAPSMPNKGPWWRMNKAKKNPDILKLLSALSWKAFPERRRIVQRFDRRCSIVVSLLLRHIQDSPCASIPVYTIWEQLNNQSRMKVALSPIICGTALQMRRDIEGDLIQSIQSRVVGQAIVDGLWCGRHFPDGPSADDSVWITGSTHAIAKMPILLNVLPLDLGEGYKQVWNSGRNTAQSSSYRSKHSKGIQQIINRSLEGIATVSEEAMDWIIDAVRVVTVRRDDLCPDGVGSSSWPNYPGLIGLLGVAGTQKIESVANGIVHESIHNLLYMIETFEPFSSDVNRTNGVTVSSPWSGRTLPLASYVHACLVWYGLAEFWTKSLDNGFFNQKEAKGEMNYSKSGFLNEKYFKNLDTNNKYLRSDISELLFAIPKNLSS